MGSTWGNNLKLSLWGESHGKAVGIVADGFPHGFKIDFSRLESDMRKRRPGVNHVDVICHSDPEKIENKGINAISTRKETDEVEIISGILDGYTTGMPISLIIKNTDVNSSDYESMKNIIRPSTSDLTAELKYEGFADMRGSGHFSGRLTAPLVAAGSLASQYIEEKFGVIISSEIRFSTAKNEKENNEKGEEFFYQELKKASKDNDSLGVKVRVIASGVKAGIGSPVFNNVESRIAQMFFSIPGVKSVSFGLGEEFNGARGSDVNDIPIICENGEIGRKTNNCGGIEGGITTGADIVSEVVFKPTPSIGILQDTIDIKNMRKAKISTAGRHDVCIGIRGRFVLEASMALVLMDMFLEK